MIIHPLGLLLAIILEFGMTLVVVLSRLGLLRPAWQTNPPRPDITIA